MSLSWKLILASANKNDSNQNEIQEKNPKQDFIESFDQVRTYIKVATLVTRHDDLSIGDKCQITESSSEGFSWNRTTSNYFYRFENWLD